MSVRHFIVSSIIFSSVRSIWPPPYRINLTHEETFVIGDWSENYDENIMTNEEDEMILEKDIKHLHLEKDKTRFKRLHKHVKKYSRQDLYLYHSKNTSIFFNETNFDLLERMPWKAGFADEDMHFIHQDNVNVFYQNTMVKQLIQRHTNEKLEESDKTVGDEEENKSEDKDYNYEELKQEYGKEIEQEMKLNETFNYTNINEENNAKEILETAIDFKSTPRNCTKEELSGIGFGAAKCIWLDMKQASSEKNMKTLFKHIFRIFLFWLFIYVIIAIPLWCHKGWCCCCFRCKYCKPVDRINEAKKFLFDNPPGVYHTTDNKIINFESTMYETYAYKQLKDQLMRI